MEDEGKREKGDESASRKNRENPQREESDSDRETLSFHNAASYL